MQLPGSPARYDPCHCHVEIGIWLMTHFDDEGEQCGERGGLLDSTFRLSDSHQRPHHFHHRQGALAFGNCFDMAKGP